MAMIVRGMQALLKNLAAMIRNQVVVPGSVSRAARVTTSGTASPVVNVVSSSKGFTRVTVGYDDTYTEGGIAAHYAVYVHENPTVYHKPPTRYKFLEEPARLLQAEMGLIIKNALTDGATIHQAIVEAAEFLLAESRKIVPVDTGRLYRSGFVR